MSHPHLSKFSHTIGMYCVKRVGKLWELAKLSIENDVMRDYRKAAIQMMEEMQNLIYIYEDLEKGSDEEEVLYMILEDLSYTYKSSITSIIIEIYVKPNNRYGVRETLSIK